MSINYWRYVEYTDDGCSLYQCLSCYETWESRTAPGYFDLEDNYARTWKFCPYCGVEWSGMRTTPFSRHHEGRRQLGSRRHRIKAAIERREKQYQDEYWSKPTGERGPYPGSAVGVPAEPPYWLVVEKAERPVRHGDRPLSWTPAFKMSGFHPSAKRMLELARKELEQERADDEASNSDMPDHWRAEFFTRVVVVRDFKARYPNKGYICEIRP